MKNHEEAAPVDEKFLTPGVMVMLAFMAVGFAFAVARFLFGIGAVSNLNNQYPWGLWVAVDVASGVALAAGGFTTGAIAYVFNRREYHAVIRPALLTAMLGYTFVVLGLLIDIGRYWNITSPLFHHNHTSVLFEVAMCVMVYSNVLYIEFLPIVVERFLGKVRLPGPLAAFNDTVETILAVLDRTLDKVMFIFIILGIVLSCMHQSGLGALMLIARYKIHPLWYTPILPLLFLLSAFAVGYPMVTFESIIVSKSFNRKPEMEVLTPLARFMPLLMGIYLAFKLGDMMVRGTYVYLLDGTVQSNCFIVEVLVGVVLPFVLLLFERIRRSPGWLFFASTLFVLGILMNRIDVFLVAYKPPYIIKSYFPALGEFFITAGLIAALMFVYRVCVTLFPVLGKRPKEMALPLLLAMAGLSLALANPAAGAGPMPERAKRPLPVTTAGFPSVDQAPKVFILNSAIINKYSDIYEPVRFMHAKHAHVLQDCTICHHRQPREKTDKYGRPVTMADLQRNKELPVACSACHDIPFNPKVLNKPGLKGAYHRLCMDCHKEAEQVPHVRGPIQYSAMVRGPMARELETRAPTDCLSCHPKKVPDHSRLVKVGRHPSIREVTADCLSCHPIEGRAILKTSHWRWQGPSPYTVGQEKRIDLGKRHHSINNFCINVSGNWKSCSRCHIGYGWKDRNFDFNDMTRIDCLVCHDTTGTYKKAANGAGYPEAGIDLAKVARSVGRPGRSNCGSCHFADTGNDPLKHAGLNPILKAPTRNCDIHMATGRDGLNFRCQDCHKAHNHMFSGRSMSTPVVEGDISCQYCHTDKPHMGSDPRVHHLNQHTRHIACQTCHAPLFAKCNATRVGWDWSTAGKDRPAQEDKYGRPTFDKRYGSFTWKEAAKPVYRWYNGTVKRSILGDRIDPRKPVELTSPVGDIRDPASRIYPFEIRQGRQIYDALYNYLVTPQLDVFWDTGDWNQAASQGMAAAGLQYSGQYRFVDTLMHWGVTHEILPKENALACAQCHGSLAKAPYCGRCHQQREGIDFKKLATQGTDFAFFAKKGRDVAGLIGKTDYIDFKALGYRGDPIDTGGRFQQLSLEPGCPQPAGQQAQ